MKEFRLKLTDEGFLVPSRDTHMGKWVEENKRLDFDQSALGAYMGYIPRNKIILDVGANIGCYAKAFALTGNVVICYEPNPEAFICLNYNLRDFSNAWLHPVALSDSYFTYKVNAESNNIGMAFIEKDPNALCSTCPLDEHYRRANGAIGFIKIDVEGYELKVLKGAVNTIRTYQPVMVIEINEPTLKREGTNREEVFSFLDSLEYSYRNIYDTENLTGEQIDIICFPKM